MEDKLLKLPVGIKQAVINVLMQGIYPNARFSDVADIIASLNGLEVIEEVEQKAKASQASQGGD